MIQRDSIERLIEQCAEFLRRALQLRKAGELEPSLAVLREAGTRLDAADRTRIAAVLPSVKLRDLDARYHATLRPSYRAISLGPVNRSTSSPCESCCCS